MEQIVESGDTRQKTWCVHCAEELDESSTRDHVPTRGLLYKPFPANLPVVQVCLECNNGFSADEQYLVALLGCVLSGTADVDEQPDPRIAYLLGKNEALRMQIASGRYVTPTLSGELLVEWVFNTKRVENVIVKNARGHALFECNEPVFVAPTSVGIAALESLSHDDRRRFEDAAEQFNVTPARLPEVGSRATTRAICTPNKARDWIVVQEGVYRYAIEQHDGTTRVRSVLREYLATEVIWNDR